jgi:predicted nuclease of restriction endonuclease-like (RecB) superfamily
MTELSNNSFFKEVKQILHQARQSAVRAVNTAMVQAYWEIGRKIVEEEQDGFAQATYGTGLLKELSISLTDEFGNGFSLANLKNFRKFYLTYPDDSKSYALRSLLSWTHHRTIMRLEDSKARQYYLETCAKENWSYRTLERQIKSHTYERLLSTQQSKQDNAIIQTDARSHILSQLKDPYVLEFLNLSEDPAVHEKDLETALISDLQKFLLELGGGFSFVARQMRISTETSHFYLDLVFYHYILKCFVVIDLKTEKLTHQDIGQMDMYVRMFDDLKRGEDDNPSIGIILCADKDETMVQYSVLKESEQLFASKYRLHLPTEAELIAELEREQARIEKRKEEQA